MEVIPAIDIRGGKCVRLFQGDYAKETVYADDPIEVASHWSKLGAKRIHIVDLDGAKDGAPANLSIVEKIVSSVDVPVQLGGGIRDAKIAYAALSKGVDRVMIGTAAVENPNLIEKLCQQFGSDRIVVSVDAKDGQVALRGWTEQSHVKATDLIQQMANAGVVRFLYTDITRDGTLTEPNFDAIGELVGAFKTNVIAAGGVSQVEHLTRLAEIGAEGAIIGKALYTGDVDLKEALAALN